MIIKINGKQIDIGDALREHVETHLTEGVQKYAERPVDATVTFSRNRHEFRCDCAVHLSTGLNAQATGRAGEVYAAFEQACERLEKQLRRYKRRLKDHHKNRTDPIQMIDAASFVIDAGEEEGDEPDSLQPVIIAETRTTIPHLSVGEAVMQMEMGGQAVLMFRNEKTDALNVVYRRDDGHIGWIDPSPVSRAG